MSICCRRFVRVTRRTRIHHVVTDEFVGWWSARGFDPLSKRRHFPIWKSSPIQTTTATTAEADQAILIPRLKKKNLEKRWEIRSSSLASRKKDLWPSGPLISGRTQRTRTPLGRVPRGSDSSSPQRVVAFSASHEHSQMLCANIYEPCWWLFVVVCRQRRRSNVEFSTSIQRFGGTFNVTSQLSR